MEGGVVGPADGWKNGPLTDVLAVDLDVKVHLVGDFGVSCGRTGQDPGHAGQEHHGAHCPVACVSRQERFLFELGLEIAWLAV
jgi:hypothetical protein